MQVTSSRERIVSQIMDYQDCRTNQESVRTSTCLGGCIGGCLSGAVPEGCRIPEVSLGRRRQSDSPPPGYQAAPGTASTMAAPSLLLVLCTASAVLRIAESCSSRSTPKPRPPSPTMRPNITFQTYDCPEAYAKWYCLNGATCFSVRIGESILYNCECADGFMGQRCEFKDLDGSYLPSRSRVMIETASIAGGVTVAVLLIFVLSLAAYTYIRRCKKLRRPADESCDSESKPINTSSCNNNESPVTGTPLNLPSAAKETARELEFGRGSGYPSTGTGPPYRSTIP